jgi:ADP-ribosylglycohydrolase
MNTNKELSRSEQSAYGAVLGALTGDAAGGVLEFMGRQPTPKECEQAFDMPGGGVFDLAPGQFTDDGEMTVSLLRALALGQGQYDPLMVAKAYSDWAASEPFDIGNATSSALRIPKSERYGVRAAELIAEQAMEYNSESKANGSLMRATPLGIAAANMTAEQTVEMACADARLTHPNPACQASTAAYVLAIRHLIQEPGSQGCFYGCPKPRSKHQRGSQPVATKCQRGRTATCAPHGRVCPLRLHLCLLLSVQSHTFSKGHP